MGDELVNVRLRPHAQQMMLAEMHSAAWGMLPDHLQALMAATLAGGMPEARVREQTQRTAGAIAVLPLVGPIYPKENFYTSYGVATATTTFLRQLKALIADDTVSAVIIDVDSPGGMVAGVPELADEMFRLRGEKPIVAVSDWLMASAAYWIGSAADEIIATPTALVGSIGVITMHADLSQALANFGVNISLITAGEHKGESNPYQPLSDEDRAALQSQVDEYYGMFTSAVAKHRGVNATDVRNGYGEGRVLTAKAAKAAGMVDRIETLEQTMARLARGGDTASRGKASADSNGLPPAEAVATNDVGDRDARERSLRLVELERVQR